MTYFKALSTFCLVLFFAITSTFGQSAERTLVKSFNLQGQDQVTLNLDGPVEVQEWAQKTVRVQMIINLHNRPDSFLKGMITAGRYNLLSDLDDNGLVINQPGLQKTVRLKSGELKESLSFIVYSPENVHVTINNAASSDAGNALSDGTL